MLLAFLALAALAAEPRVIPGSKRQIDIDASADHAVDDAFGALEAGRFDDAALAFAALADAGAGADAHHLEALARYEAGDLRRADRATTDGVAVGPDHGPLLALRGLVLADLGRGDEAAGFLDRAERVAGDDAALRARIALTRGLVALDAGSQDAVARFTEAAERADAAGDAETARIARENLALARARAGEGAAADLLGRVSEKLRAGDVSGARALVPAAAPADRRATARRHLAEAAVARADGRLHDATALLDRALGVAREGGLVREAATALGQLGIVHGLTGQHRLALSRLDEAVDMVADTTLRVIALELRIEAGRAAVHAGDLDRASRELTAARELASSGPALPEAVRVDELAGLLAAARGAPEASDLLARAVDAHAARGAVADAARVATERVELLAGTDAADDAEARALALFRDAADHVGPAHVANARGLGLAAKGDVEGALAAFAVARERAEAVGSPTGARVADVARANAAAALVSLGHTARAESLGLDDAVARHERFTAARSAYEQGTAAYAARRYGDARGHFDDALTAFQDLRELPYAQAARRGRAWAAYNAAISQDPAQAYPFWDPIVQDALQVGDAELEVRATAARALTAAQLGYGDPVPALRKAADAAEAHEIVDVAVRCWGELAEREGDFADRIRAARQASALDPDAQAAVYAMYLVALEAYQADDYDLALQLTGEALPHAGDLAPLLDEVARAAEGAKPE